MQETEPGQEQTASEGQIINPDQELQAQQNRLGYFATNGFPDEITDERFPLLSPDRIALAKYFATDRHIDVYRNALKSVVDLRVQKRLGATIYQMETARDEALFEALPHIKGEEVEHSQPLHLSQENNQLLGFALNVGLPDLMDVRKLPFLASLSPDDRRYLVNLATMNRREKETDLRKQGTRQEDAGYYHRS